MATKELFSQLREFKWRTIPFPTSTFSVRLRHDLVQHKFPGKDGADIEDTGRAPLEFTANIPFRNGVSGGPNETWPSVRNPLYPNQYREFIKVCSDRDSGVLDHPEFGKILCRIESCETVWDATRRDGVDVHVTWLETIDVESLDSVLAQKSPISQAIAAGLALDEAITTRNPAVPKQDTTYKPDFADSMRSLQAVSDQYQVLNTRVAGKINSVMYRVESLHASLDKSADSKDWPITQAIERLKASANELRKELVRLSGRNIVYYIVRQDTTLAAIAQATGAPIPELIVLNPKSCARPVVAGNTIIRYYHSARR